MTERGATTDRRAATERRTVIRWIVQTSLNLRYIVVAASVVLMVLGIVALPQMRVDVFPEFAPPRVVIQTACVGLSTSDVEASAGRPAPAPPWAPSCCSRRPPVISRR
jgi:hypothetical protein